MTTKEAIQKAIKETDVKITAVKEIMQFPTYLLGVKEGLEWALKILKQTESTDLNTTQKEK